jgi:flagellin
MRVQHNIAAMNSYRNYSNNTKTINKNLEKLSSGYKINRAGDNAAGLAISEKMRAQITGLDVAQKNAKDGISLVQTAEGALTEVHSMLNRMVELAEQSANGTYDSSLDRDQLQKEVNQLRTEIDRIADSSNFNGIKLLDGSMGGGAISTNETTVLGADISDFTAAKATGTKNDFSAAKACIDKFEVDGQVLTVDWNKGDAAKVLAQMQQVDSSTITDDSTGKKYAQDLTEFFNNEIKAQGLSGSVKITYEGSGKFAMNSLRDDASSTIGWAGSDNAKSEESLGNLLFGTGGETGTNAVVEATKKVGVAFASEDVFNMTINGTTVNVTLSQDIAKDSDLSAVATKVEKDIQTAIDSYNTALGYTATSSPEHFLTKGDFTVTADPSGGLKVAYNGEKDVSFSFSESTNTVSGKPGKTAGLLGLADASSIKGGARGLTLQIGDTGDSFNQLKVSISDMHASAMKISGVDISTQTGAANAMDAIKSAINYVSDCRGTLGATQNRLEHTINNLSVMQENIQDAESTIRDTDVADEMMKYTKNSILVQSAQAMLAQANQQPQGVLQLLQ